MSKALSIPIHLHTSPQLATFRFPCNSAPLCSPSTRALDNTTSKEVHIRILPFCITQDTLSWWETATAFKGSVPQDLKGEEEHSRAQRR